MIPRIRFRVVWGRDVTIATFCPTSRFTNVDFPALGRPSTATKPERNDLFIIEATIDHHITTLDDGAALSTLLRPNGRDRLGAFKSWKSGEAMPATPHVESHFTDISPWKGAFQTVVTGGIAAAAAFGLARLVS